MKKITIVESLPCEKEKTDYFFIDLPNIRVVINKFKLYFRDVKDDNWINNIFIKEIKTDDKNIKSLRQMIKFLGVE